MSTTESKATMTWAQSEIRVPAASLAMLHSLHFKLAAGDQRQRRNLKGFPTACTLLGHTSQSCSLVTLCLTSRYRKCLCSTLNPTTPSQGTKRGVPGTGVRMVIKGCRSGHRYLLVAIGTIACCGGFLLPAPQPRTTGPRGTSNHRSIAVAPTRAPSPTRVQASGVVDGQEQSPIFEAIMAGDIAGVEEYVRSGGDCNVRDLIGDTPLMLAVESELIAAVATLSREGGADVNSASEATGETPLQLASYYGYTHLAKMLVNDCGADLETRNKKGETALSLASFWGNTETVEFLLEAGADPNNRTDAGSLPGEKFDSVFVPKPQERFDQDGTDEQPGPREVIVSLLEKARTARRGTAVGVKDV